jgi:hypothetical protein
MQSLSFQSELIIPVARMTILIRFVFPDIQTILVILATPVM